MAPVDEPFEVAGRGRGLPVTEVGAAGRRSFSTAAAAAADYMAECAAALDGRFSTVRYTQRGTPPSEAQPPYTIEAHMADALAVLDASGSSARGRSATPGAGTWHCTSSSPTLERLEGILCIGAPGAFIDAFTDLDRNMSDVSQTRRTGRSRSRSRSDATASRPRRIS